jgi:hypothetical protein
MSYDGCVTDVLGVADELGAAGCVVAIVVGWYLEFCENLVNLIAISSPTMFLVNLTCSEKIADISSGVTEVNGCDTFAVCTSFVESNGGRIDSLICVAEPRRYFAYHARSYCTSSSRAFLRSLNASQTSSGTSSNKAMITFSSLISKVVMG